MSDWTIKYNQLFIKAQRDFFSTKENLNLSMYQFFKIKLKNV